MGKEKNGSTTPIRTKLKLNSHGVGYNPGEEFTNNWWERVFNDAAANIHPIKGQVCVKRVLFSIQGKHLIFEKFNVNNGVSRMELSSKPRSKVV